MCVLCVCCDDSHGLANALEIQEEPITLHIYKTHPHTHTRIYDSHGLANARETQEEPITRTPITRTLDVYKTHPHTHCNTHTHNHDSHGLANAREIRKKPCQG